jgi:hypothetical protein
LRFPLVVHHTLECALTSGDACFTVARRTDQFLASTRPAQAATTDIPRSRSTSGARSSRHSNLESRPRQQHEHNRMPGHRANRSRAN